MIRLACFYCFLVCFTSTAQFHFVKQGRLLIPKRDTLIHLTYADNYSGEFDYFQDSTTQLAELIKGIIVRENKNRIETLQESYVLSFLSQYSLNNINSIKEQDKEKAFRNHRKIKRVFYASRCSFGIISIYSFDLPIVKAKGTFYYNRNGEAGGFNLYKGKKLNSKQIKKGKEPIPLSNFSYAEIKNLLQRNIVKQHINTVLRNRNVAAMGLAIQLRKNTCNRNTIPKVRVVVILGEKRFSKTQRNRLRKKETATQ